MFVYLVNSQGNKIEYTDGKEVKKEHGTHHGFKDGKDVKYKDSEKNKHAEHYDKSHKSQYGKSYKSHAPIAYHPNHNYHGSYSHHPPAVAHKSPKGQTYRQRWLPKMSTTSSKPGINSFNAGLDDVEHLPESSTNDPKLHPFPDQQNLLVYDEGEDITDEEYPSDEEDPEDEKRMFFSPRKRPITLPPPPPPPKQLHPESSRPPMYAPNAPNFGNNGPPAPHFGNNGPPPPNYGNIGPPSPNFSNHGPPAPNFSNNGLRSPSMGSNAPTPNFGNNGPSSLNFGKNGPPPPQNSISYQQFNPKPPPPPPFGNGPLPMFRRPEPYIQTQNNKTEPIPHFIRQPSVFRNEAQNVLSPPVRNTILDPIPVVYSTIIKVGPAHMIDNITELKETTDSYTAGTTHHRSEVQVFDEKNKTETTMGADIDNNRTPSPLHGGPQFLYSNNNLPRRPSQHVPRTRHLRPVLGAHNLRPRGHIGAVFHRVHQGPMMTPKVPVNNGKMQYPPVPMHPPPALAHYANHINVRGIRQPKYVPQNRPRNRPVPTPNRLPNRRPAPKNPHFRGNNGNVGRHRGHPPIPPFMNRLMDSVSHFFTVG